ICCVACCGPLAQRSFQVRIARDLASALHLDLFQQSSKLWGPLELESCVIQCRCDGLIAGAVKYPDTDPLNHDRMGPILRLMSHSPHLFAYEIFELWIVVGIELVFTIFCYP